MKMSEGATSESLPVSFGVSAAVVVINVSIMIVSQWRSPRQSRPWFEQWMGLKLLRMVVLLRYQAIRSNDSVSAIEIVNRILSGSARLLLDNICCSHQTFKHHYFLYHICHQNGKIRASRSRCCDIIFDVVPLGVNFAVK